MRRSERVSSEGRRARGGEAPRRSPPWGLIGFGAVVAITTATVVVFLVMQLLVLPHLLDLADTRPFDTRFAGYDRATAIALLKALGPIGRGIYLKIDLPLDTAFALLYLVALTLALAELLGRAGVPRRFVFVVAAVVVLPTAAFDLAENAAIAEMLRRTPDLVGADLVATASFRTVAKWISAGGGILVALLAEGLVLRRSRSETNR